MYDNTSRYMYVYMARGNELAEDEIKRSRQEVYFKLSKCKIVPLC